MLIVHGALPLSGADEEDHLAQREAARQRPRRRAAQVRDRAVHVVLVVLELDRQPVAKGVLGGPLHLRSEW